MSIRAATYARVSTDDEDQATSIPNQIAMCREEARKLGCELVAEHQDTKTGGDLDRPGWRAIESLIVNKEIDLLIVKARSRIVRDELSWKLLERDLFLKYGVRVHPLMGVVKTDDPNSELAVSIEVLFDAHYRRMVKYNTIKAMRQLLERGFWRTRIPFGCMRGEITGVPVKDPATWPVLEQIFRLAAAGHCIPAICEHLRLIGASGPNGNEWGNSSVRRVVSSPFYAGKAYLQGKEYQLLHQCTVDCWEEAQACIGSTKIGRPSEYNYILPRVVTDMWEVTQPAQQVGQPVPLHGKWVNGRGRVRHYYYYRADRTRNFGGIKAKPATAEAERMRSTVRADALERVVVETLIENVDLLPASFNTLQPEIADEAALRQRLTQLRTAIGHRKSQLHKSRMALADAFVASRTIGEALEERVNQLQVEIDAGQAEIQNITAKLADIKQSEDQAGESFNLIKVLWESGEREKLRRLLETVIETVIVRLDEVVLCLAISPVRGMKGKPALTGDLVSLLSRRRNSAA